MFLHFLIYLSMFCDDDWPEFLINLEKFQPLKKVLGGGSLGFCFCFKSDSSVDTMIKVPPTTQKIMIVSHEIDGVKENVVSSQIVQHFVEFIHHNWLDQWESDFWDRI